VKDKRQFPRIDLRSLPEEMVKILGASVAWPWKETTVVQDMSFSGAALAVPAKKTVTAGDELELEFLVEGLANFKSTVAVAWVGQHIVGVKFTAMDATDRLNFEKFLQSKVIGLGVRLVNPHFYGPNSQFTYWFHGPHEFNVFLWQKNGSIDQARIEMGADSLDYSDEKFQLSAKDPEPAGRATSASLQENLSLQETIRKALEILSQVQDSKELLAPLVRLLMNTPV